MICQNHLRRDILSSRNANIYTSWRVTQNVSFIDANKYYWNCFLYHILGFMHTTKSGYEIIHFAQLQTKRATLGKKFWYQTYIAGDSLASTSPSIRCGEGDLCGSSTRIPLSLFVPIIALMAWGLRLGVAYAINS